MAEVFCSICKRPVTEKFRPFCSARCADVDLGRWLGESYRVPVVEAEEDSDAAKVNVTTDDAEKDA